MSQDSAVTHHLCTALQNYMEITAAHEQKLLNLLYYVRDGEEKVETSDV